MLKNMFKKHWLLARREQITLAAAILACQSLIGPALAADRDAGPSDASTKAHDLYLEKRFADALPFYQKVLDNLKSTGCSDTKIVAHAEAELADCLCQVGEFARARTIYESLLKNIAGEAGKGAVPHSELKRRLIYNIEIAGTYFRQDNYSDAERYLNTAMEQLPGVPEDQFTKETKNNFAILLGIYMGETMYRQNKYEGAVKVFRAALEGLQKSGTVSYDYSKMLLGSLAGSYDQLKQYDQSVPIYRAMAMLDRAYCGDTDINYGWSLLELSDALKAAGKPKEAAPLYEKAVWIFRDSNSDRLAEKYGLTDEKLKQEEEDASIPREKVERDKQLARTLRADVFGNGDTAEKKNGDKDLAPPGTAMADLFEHCQAPKRAHLGAWNVKPIKHSEAPGWVWTDPSVPQKALMLCVHGLGLHHRAFQSFAERIVGQGFTVVSFDVRGFGAYMQAKGHDHLDMKACVDDLISVIGLIKRDYPGKPVFLLGESMGGALAMRVAAEDPDIIDGLVCSVPAAERHAETGTKLKVGLKLLTGGSKQVNLEHAVVDKSVATNDQRERREWLEDPHARLKLSARELVQFDHFMKQNKNYAAKICHTPVLLFQGTSDRLVKEEGTQNLFRALTTRDKALVLLGNQEHLIFEANPYKDDVTLGIIGWLNAHAETQNACPR